MSKEQEITSLNHRNQVLEGEVEKMESSLKEAKDAANQSAQHDTQNEALQRRLQILEEEAEEADRNLRETNEKYGRTPPTAYLSMAVPGPYVPLRYGLAGTRTIGSRMHVLTRFLFFLLQAPPNRCQGWSLRTQGAGARVLPGPVGEQVRGDGKEAHRVAKGPARSRGLDQQRLRRIGLGTGVKIREIWDSSVHPIYSFYFFFFPFLSFLPSFLLSLPKLLLQCCFNLFGLAGDTYSVCSCIII